MLSKRRRQTLVGLLTRLYTIPRPSHEAVKWLYHTPTKQVDLDSEGLKLLESAIDILTSVDSWKEAYPRDVLATRSVKCILDTNAIEDAVDKLLSGLEKDCKACVAYAPIFGFTIEPGSAISFGNARLAVIGKHGFQSEIIDILRRQVEEMPSDAKDDRVSYAEKLLTMHENLPILRVPFSGSVAGAREFVGPIAERVAEFMQFAIGTLTDQNSHIIDHRGRFSGEFVVSMPVIEVDGRAVSFPNVRGDPHRVNLTGESVSKLERSGVLAMASIYVEPVWQPKNAMETLICRAIRCFAEGERALTDIARIVSYVTVVEIFASRRSELTKTYCLGVAASTESESESFMDLYELAKHIYTERGAAAHSGVEPRLAYFARQKAGQTILRMLAMRDTLRTKSAIDHWIDGFRNRLPESDG